MHVKTFHYLDLLNLFKNQESEKIGLYFSFFLHLIFLIFVIDFPNFFKSPPINIPTVIPIEIINVSNITSIQKEVESTQEKSKTIENPKPKKFNTVKSESTEQLEIKTKTQENLKDLKIIESKPKKFNSIKPELIKKVEIKTKPERELNKSKVVITKKQIENDNKDLVKKDSNIVKNIDENKIESLPTKVIKPKIKPRPKSKTLLDQQDSDIRVQVQPKPEPSFNIASMLKDLRSDKISIQKQKIENNEKDDKNKLNKKEELTPQNAQLSISEIDLLYQQLKMCWSAPAGADIKRGMKVRVSAKIKPDRNVLKDSVRIVDTNISKSNRFYYAITESALRTLMNPKCNPLKLPEDKYDLWKSLIITFDHSNMKGY